MYDKVMLTEKETEKILGNVFSSLHPLRLKVFSAKEKKKVATLQRIVEEFEAQRRYTEPEVNVILGAIYQDVATLRRALVEYDYMDRTLDGREYWRR